MNNKKGSLTLESAVIFPFVIMIFLSVTLFLRIVYTYEVIQEAISSTIGEISAYGYIKDKFDPKSNEALEFIMQYVEEPAIDLAAKQLFLNNLHAGREISTDDKLYNLGITGGSGSLDFNFKTDISDSKLFTVDVKYIISTGVLPKIEIHQSGTGRFWSDNKCMSEAEEDIWSLDNFTRGRKIREVFGANLPFNFPVIASFKESSGTVVMIKSMDLTAVSYEDPSNITRKVQAFIKELSDYRGQSVPWGSDKIVIDPPEIISRELILVIPANELTSLTENELSGLSGFALINGVSLKIKRYGIKKVDMTD